mmetsp:Transcript_31094/g.54052  ORF Transcript_31094/g.54052 Transcript_31094/m.54052 type:complete len:246 (-) Transcript_31094:142-879(-)|eukprot:CAMPEP_0204913330 /NCGR_PEP_ID=MMETSP1397-20131031/11245_1 /ASSEMBLY_ACC=CAM_ASM_000891 /TAXON_ID=49980 /ORGANISM="Climacostomum Climacostomum virens, Strain Stock W-24" /LENGTH=245 /DNA_ID=CAMNT_0052084543 /DNA_START=238 /DNA_END=975 /DNA_ORIENTATION=+
MSFDLKDFKFSRLYSNDDYKTQIAALACLLYTFQRFATGIPYEFLIVCDHAFYILEVLFCYQSISLPSAVIVSGLLIYADDQINKYLLEGDLAFELDLEVMIFAFLIAFIYLIRPQFLDKAVPKATVNICKGLRSAIGSAKFAKKIIGKYGLTSQAFKLLYSVLYIKLGFTSIIHFCYSKLAGYPTDLRQEVRETAIKCLLLVGFAFVCYHQSINFALACDLLFVWWYFKKSVHKKDKVGKGIKA